MKQGSGESCHPGPFSTVSAVVQALRRLRFALTAVDGQNNVAPSESRQRK